MFDIKIKQVSSLIKVRNIEDFKETDILQEKLYKGEHFAYQVSVYSGTNVKAICEIESPLTEYITAYTVNNAVVDYAAPSFADDDFISKEPCIMPDILIPLSDHENIVHLNGITTIWVDVNIPVDCKPGKYDIKINFKNYNNVYCEDFTIYETMTINIIDSVVPEQELIVTQWFHTDCIAKVYNVEIYSEEHWNLIDKFMKTASELGINMMLTPIFTPHLDTEYGVERPNVQLVDIYKENGKYNFDFTRLKRWIKICKKNNIKYFEIAHLFSQWGLKCTPNIMVKENGKDVILFGWHTESDSSEYATFLKLFLPELVEFLKNEDIKEYTFFHISDEPSFEHLEKYKFASELVKPLIDGCKIIDACSETEIFEEKMLNIPVAASDVIHSFIEKDIRDLFVYYCCAQVKKVANRFIAMPAYRNRIIGLQMYKYDIKGFLHWGYNFYYNGGSHYTINPYVTTAANKHFPSGDSFSVYPGNDGPVCSTRALVFKDALQDIQLCKLLESYVGKEKVIELIEKEAGMEITFNEYPRNNDFIINVIDKIKENIEKHQQSN